MLGTFGGPPPSGTSALTPVGLSEPPAWFLLLRTSLCQGVASRLVLALGAMLRLPLLCDLSPFIWLSKSTNFWPWCAV